MIISIILSYALDCHLLGSFGFILSMLLIYEIISFLFDYLLIRTKNAYFKCINTEDRKIIFMIILLFFICALISFIFLEISEICYYVYSKSIAGAVFGLGISFVTYFKWKIDIDKLKTK